MKFHHLAAFIAEAVVILWLAKLGRDLVLKRRGYDVNEMVAQKRSAAAATSQAGYLIGVLLGFLGAVTARSTDATFAVNAGAIALAGLMAIVLQLVADIISDNLVFRGVAAHAGTAQDVNLPLAVGKAAVSLATGMVLRGAMSDAAAGLLARVIWFGAAQAAMVTAVLLYCRTTPYDDLAEIKRGNLAAGFPLAGILLAVGVIIEAALVAKSASPSGSGALGLLALLGVSLLLVIPLRFLGSRILLPKTKLVDAIVKEQNVGAGIQEGLSFLVAALIVTFFLT